jgi:hypothetical protein
VRWSHLTILLFGLALTTALAPLPLAYAAAVLGLIGVIAIFRQWNWDEEDRSAGVPGSERRIRVDNDLTNEGLFANDDSNGHFVPFVMNLLLADANTCGQDVP